VVYEYTQSGRLASSVVLVLWLFGALSSAVDGKWGAIVLVSVVVLPLAALLSSMTMKVTEDALEWHLGCGLVRRRIPLRDITGVALHNISYWRIGIHTQNFRDWMWSVGARSAVRVNERNGHITFLGTDDAAGLVAALRSVHATGGADD